MSTKSDTIEPTKDDYQLATVIGMAIVSNTSDTDIRMLRDKLAHTLAKRGRQAVEEFKKRLFNESSIEAARAAYHKEISAAVAAWGADDPPREAAGKASLQCMRAGIEAAIAAAENKQT